MNLREQNIRQLGQVQFDVLIVGGGINGAVSAAALAARGAKVALIDARDFAGFTSQQSSNLVWGGIKYLENFEFGLVAGLCKSRNQLLRSFPSTVKEIRFLTTVLTGFRYHPLMLLVGSWLYWLFGRGVTATPKYFTRARIAAQEPMVNTRDSLGGIEYSDAYLHDNDARFVFNFVRGAMDRGCVAANYVNSSGGRRVDADYWAIEAEDLESGNRFTIRARVLINAAGAFVDEYNERVGIETEYRHMFSKGIHLIVPQISKNKRVLAFFANDGRLFFAIPMANRTCIGTTDTYVDDPHTNVSDADRDFVLSNINARLNLSTPLTRAEVIAERCGVRPLAIRKGQDAQTDFLQLSRKHVVETQTEKRHISIFGGKLTDCLNVGDEICERVADLGVSLTEPESAWYGEPGDDLRKAFYARARQLGIDENQAGDTGEMLSDRLWRRYGANADAMLDAIEKDAALCRPLIENTGIRYCELDYLVNREMIVKLEDLLRRRSKVELLLSAEQLRNSRDLFAACEKMFGSRATQVYQDYFERIEREKKSA